MKLLQLIKQAVKWYFRRMSETYVMTPTGMVLPRE